MADDGVFGGGYSRYYDLLYKDKDYAGEAQFVRGLISEYAPEAASVLELGSGSGRHAALLAEAGLRVHGVEMSQAMLDRAKARAALLPHEAKSVSFEKGDIRYYETVSRYDAVISLFHVMSYQAANDDVQAAMQTASKALKPGGIFIFDCWYGPCVLSEPPQVRIKRLEDDQTCVTRLCEPRLDPRRNTVDVEYEILVSDRKSGMVETFAETHRMRYLFTPEVEGFLRGAGLEPVASGQWMTRKSPGLDTFSVYFVARKV